MRLSYEGVDISDDVSIACAWHEMHSEGRTDSLLLKCADTRNLWDRWGPKAGDQIEVSDAAARSGRMFVYDVRPESSLIVIKAMSAPEAATRERRSKSWEKVKLLQLVSEIANRHGLSYETYGVTDHTYARVEQVHEPDFQFLARRCAYEGACFLVFDGKLVVYSGRYMDGQTPMGELEIVPGQNYSFQADEDARYGACEVTDGSVTATFRISDGKVKKATLRDRITDPAEGERFATGLLRHVNKGTRTMTLATDTFLRQYAAGSMVEISASAAASWDGPAFITDMRHDYMTRSSKLWARQAFTDY